MPRLPLASRDNVPENQRDLFDTLVGGGGKFPAVAPVRFTSMFQRQRSG